MHDRAAGDPTRADQQRAAIADDGAAGHPEIEFDPAEADDGADVDALGEYALDTARDEGSRRHATRRHDLIAAAQNRGAARHGSGGHNLRAAVGYDPAGGKATRRHGDDTATGNGGRCRYAAGSDDLSVAGADHRADRAAEVVRPRLPGSC